MDCFKGDCIILTATGSLDSRMVEQFLTDAQFKMRTNLADSLLNSHRRKKATLTQISSDEKSVVHAIKKTLVAHKQSLTEILSTSNQRLLLLIRFQPFSPRTTGTFPLTSALRRWPGLEGAMQPLLQDHKTRASMFRESRKREEERGGYSTSSHWSVRVSFSERPFWFLAARNSRSLAVRRTKDHFESSPRTVSSTSPKQNLRQLLLTVSICRNTCRELFSLAFV